MLQHDATHYNALQRTAVNGCAALRHTCDVIEACDGSVLQCDAVCCSVLLSVTVCCSVLQCAAVCCSMLQYIAVCCSVTCDT